MRLFFGVLTVCILTSAAAGRPIFVNNQTGDNRAAGEQARTSADLTGPVRTIAHALELVKPGDVVVLADTKSPYRECVVLTGRRSSGTAEQPFILYGNGAVLDTSSPIPSSAWQHVQGAIFRFQPRLTTYQQLFLDGRPVPQTPPDAKAKNHLPKLEPRQWCILDGWMYFCVERTKLPADYKLSCAKDSTGVTLYHVDHVQIVDLTVQGFQSDGIQLSNSARNVRLSGVTCRANGRSGVAVGGASTVEILKSTLEGNGITQLLTSPYSKTRVTGSRLTSKSAPAWLDQGGELFIDGKQVHGGPNEFPPVAGREQKP